MKRLASALAVGAVLGLVSTASAGERSLVDFFANAGSSLSGQQPVLVQGYQGVPRAPAVDAKAPKKGQKGPKRMRKYPDKGKPVPQGVPLFRNVHYKDLDEVHPCAVPKIVRVPNPCYKPCSCCPQPRCVFIKICVPPCACLEVDVEHDGDVEYNYGDYGIDVRQKDGYIEVDYQD